MVFSVASTLPSARQKPSLKTASRSQSAQTAPWATASTAQKAISATITFAAGIPELANIGDLRITDKIRNSGWWLQLEESLRKSHRALTTAVTSINRLLTQLGEDENIESLLREMTHARDPTRRTARLAGAFHRRH